MLRIILKNTFSFYSLLFRKTVAVITCCQLSDKK
jgi:hypothetical protein